MRGRMKALRDAFRQLFAQQWRGTFPELDEETMVIAVVAMLVFVTCMQTGRPHQLAEFFPAFEQRIPFDRGLAWHLYSQLVFCMTLLVIPATVLKLGLGRKLHACGLRFSGTGRGFVVALGLFVLLLPVLWLASRMQGFQDQYPKLRSAESDVAVFCIYQAGYLVKWMAWEFFFRGFLLFGLRPRMGDFAVIVSTLAFVVAHIGKPGAEMVGSIVAGFVLCGLALRYRSIFPGVILHFLVAATMDLLGSPGLLVGP